MPTAPADCYSPLRNCSIRGLDFQGVEIHKLQVGEITLKAFIQSICTLQKFCLMLLLFFFNLIKHSMAVRVLKMWQFFL